ncbi:MAG: fatty acid desaturase [Methylacidiphilales bacterium]|nr:fatty acid desaturase [Candidatus Methylacidiphilales bacterium]
MQDLSKRGSLGEQGQGGGIHDWKEIVQKYQTPSIGRSTWQIVNTIVPYVLLWGLMYFCLAVSYWLVVPLAILAGGFLVRTFIIFHDCTHGSYFKSRMANDILGFFTGVITFTPYHHWRWQHSIHHSTAGDLDKRGMGDIWTLTVQEYLESSRARRFAYRLARNPFVLFVVAPMILFLVLNRIPSPEAKNRERVWTHATSLGIVMMALLLISVFGLKAYLIIQLTILLVGSASGVWLFYVQHQFEDVSWERHENWDFSQAALQGSSFYKLPKILQWFSGNIGFHHIHHLSPRIPNYRLERAHKSEPLFQTVKPLTLRKSLKSFNVRLWDEKQRKLVGYRALKAHHRKVVK